MASVGKIDGVQIGGTLIAGIIAPVIFAVSAFVINIVTFFVNYVFTVVRPEIISFLCTIPSAVGGAIIARAACDAVLKKYYHRAIAIEVCLLVLAGLAFELMVMPFGWGRVSPIFGLLAMAGGAVYAFWPENAP